MNDKLWRAVCAAGCAAMLAAALASAVLGGCDTQLATTSGSTCYMKCHWCFRASAVVCALGAASFAAQGFAEGARVRRASAGVSGTAALAAILLNATPIVGICAKEGMACGTTAAVVNVLCAVCVALAVAAAACPAPGPKKPKLGL